MSSAYLPGPHSLQFTKPYLHVKCVYFSVTPLLVGWEAGGRGRALPFQPQMYAARRWCQVGSGQGCPAGGGQGKGPIWYVDLTVWC